MNKKEPVVPLFNYPDESIVSFFNDGQAVTAQVLPSRKARPDDLSQCGL
ncbi:MAG: hypothetical protein L3J66_00025 [Bacteroidales bacterium]|nr:hypothetical protein [Bacteroidales bacterium]